MKIGMRKPSLKKSIKARTTGKMKRKLKKAVNPLYGKKGMGFIKNPSRAVKNKIYRKTTFGVSDIVKAGTPKKKRSSGVSTTGTPNGGTSGCLVVLLVIFWPIGIIYLIYRLVKKAKPTYDGQPVHYAPMIEEPVEPLAKDVISQENAPDMEDFPDISFIFTDIPYVTFNAQDEKRYILEGSNAEKAQRDIMALNRYLQDAIALTNGAVPAFHIAQIVTEPVGLESGAVHFSQMFLSPKTPTGKKSKYPLRISFQTMGTENDFVGDDLFGTVYYLANGTIGKAEIICWKGHEMTLVHLAIKQGELCVNKIERGIDGERTVIFKADK